LTDEEKHQSLISKYVLVYNDRIRCAEFKTADNCSCSHDEQKRFFLIPKPWNVVGETEMTSVLQVFEILNKIAADESSFRHVRNYIKKTG
jgi:hypothetical protein